MPRMIRLVPIRMPIGIAVTHDSANAPNTRIMLHSVCSRSVEFATPSVIASTNLPHTACGVGRNSGLIHPMSVIRNQSAISTTVVTMLIVVLLPWPGAPYTWPGAAAPLAKSRASPPAGSPVAAGATACAVNGSLNLGMGGLLVRFARTLVAVDDAEHGLAHVDEIGARLPFSLRAAFWDSGGV